MYAVLPSNIQTTDYCDVTSPYVYCRASAGNGQRYSAVHIYNGIAG